MALTLYWRCESTTLDWNGSSGNDFYASGGDSTADGSFLSATAAKYGTNGILADAVGEVCSFDPQFILDPLEGQVAFAVKFVTSVPASNSVIFDVRSDTTTDKIDIRLRGTGDIGLFVVKDGVGNSIIETSGVGMTTGVWYFIVAKWESAAAGGPRRSIAVYDTNGTIISATTNPSTSTSAYDSPTELGPTGNRLRIGDYSGWISGNSAHFDNLFCASSYDDPIADNLTITAYSQYGASGSILPFLAAYRQQ
jgi:hypothetical protein